MKPLFTHKDLKSSSTKRPMPWNQLEPLVIRFNVALQDVLTGESTESSRVDIATLYSFILAAKELGHADDDGLIAESSQGLARAYTRINEGHAFRLDAVSAEAIKEMIPAYEMLAKSLSERDYMKACNHIPNYLKATL